MEDAAFRRPLHLLILLGMVAYATASESLAFAAVGGGGLLLNLWLARTGKLRVLPRPIANILSLAALAWAGWKAANNRGDATFLLGQFLLLAQLVRLWQRRTRRDDGQLLVMNLVMMVVASIKRHRPGLRASSDGLCAHRDLLRPVVPVEPRRVPTPPRGEFCRSSPRTLPPACCARPLGEVCPGADGGPPERGGPRGRRRLRPDSPREGRRYCRASPSYSRADQKAALSGFSDQVSLGQVSRIGQSRQIVGYIAAWLEDRPLTGRTLLVRGVTLDTYTGRGDARLPPWQWIRTTLSSSMNPLVIGETLPLTTRAPPTAMDAADHARTDGHQRAVRAPRRVNITPQSHAMNVIVGSDGSFQTDQPSREPIEYEVVSSGTPRDAGPLPKRPRKAPENDPLLAFARRPEVSGKDEQGALADRRPYNSSSPHPLDGQIATAIARHLHSNYSYTLDLSGAAADANGRDPIERFLFDLKRGHCEYFAGAMALLCQRLGLAARVVTGFKCDEFNTLTGSYVLRQSQAHAWVEVLTPDGWATFDPTAADDEAFVQPPAALAAGGAPDRLCAVFLSTPRGRVRRRRAEKTVARGQRRRRRRRRRRSFSRRVEPAERIPPRRLVSRLGQPHRRRPVRHARRRRRRAPFRR